MFQHGDPVIADGRPGIVVGVGQRVTSRGYNRVTIIYMVEHPPAPGWRKYTADQVVAQQQLPAAPTPVVYRGALAGRIRRAHRRQQARRAAAFMPAAYTGAPYGRWATEQMPPVQGFTYR